MTPNSQPVFMSIRQIAQTKLLPEHILRKWQKAGKLPGFYSGKKFLVNYTILVQELEEKNSQFYN